MEKDSFVSSVQKFSAQNIKIGFILGVSFILSFLFFSPISVLAKSVDDFSDVSEIPKWAQSPINHLLEKQIMSGNQDGSFAPFDPINRAELCKILVLATQTEIPNNLKPSFSDVSQDAWFFDSVQTAKEKGWIDGYPDGLFRPAATINQAEISKILVQAFDLEVSEPEVGEAWFRPYLLALKQKSFLPYDRTLDNINPSGNPTRSEVAEQVYRILYHFETAEQDAYEKQKKAEEAAQPKPYNPSDENGLHSTISETAGELHIEKIKALHQKVFAYHSEKNVEALRLKFRAEKNPIKVQELQFRRIGSGKFSDFSTAMIEVDGKVISSKVLVQNDLIRIRLLQGFIIPKSKSREVALKVNLSDQGVKGTSSRFVLYLPQWIAADSEKRIGFFPFGGIDLEIKN